MDSNRDIQYEKYWTMLINRHQLIRSDMFMIKKYTQCYEGNLYMSPGEVWYVTINVACPTQTFILWIALLGRTRTKELLLKWNMTVNIKCVFVNHSETL